MGHSSPWSSAARPGAPPPTGVQIIKYVGDKWVINMWKEKARLKWRRAGVGVDGQVPDLDLPHPPQSPS